jgi:hypothetical protein
MIDVQQENSNEIGSFMSIPTIIGLNTNVAIQMLLVILLQVL